MSGERIIDLPSGTTPAGTEPLESVQAGVSVQFTVAQVAGFAAGIDQLTGDVTAGPGSGSQVATLSTVNSDVGSFTNANITVNAKGLITAAANGSAGSGQAVSLDLVTTGTTHTVTISASTNKQVIWSSSSSGAKGTTIGNAASAVGGLTIGIATTLGNGDMHTITPNGGDTIAGSATYTFVDSNPQGSNIPMMSDGVSNWIIL